MTSPGNLITNPEILLLPFFFLYNIKTDKVGLSFSTSEWGLGWAVVLLGQIHKLLCVSIKLNKSRGEKHPSIDVISVWDSTVSAYQIEIPVASFATQYQISSHCLRAHQTKSECLWCQSHWGLSHPCATEKALALSTALLRNFTCTWSGDVNTAVQLSQDPEFVHFHLKAALQRGFASSLCYG